jgi:hypothetical protein
MGRIWWRTSYGENLVANLEGPEGGVSQMGVQVGNGALAGHNGLHKEAKHGEHCQAAVLDLLHLQLSKGVGVVSQGQGVEGTTGVQGVQTLNAGGRAVGTESLSLAQQDDLQKRVT